jgi:PAP2 superfamily
MATTGAVPASRRGGLARVPRWLREVLLIGILYGAYELSRGLRTGTVHIATRNGRDILHWERVAHLDPERLFTHALIDVTPLCVAAAYFYSTMHYIVTPVVLVWMYRCHAKHYRTARTALAFTTVVGLVVFYLLPTAPPRLLAGAHIPDALYDVRNWGWWGGEGSVPRGLGGLTNQFAAMPSLHVGWALWCGYLLARYATRMPVRVLGVLYPLATTFVVLATGNHYLLDAVAGAAVTAVGTGLALLSRAEVRRVRAALAGRRRARDGSAAPSEAIFGPAPDAGGPVAAESTASVDAGDQQAGRPEPASTSRR